MMLQIGQPTLQLKEEPLTRLVVVGKHMQSGVGRQMSGDGGHVVILHQRGRRNGYRLAPRREHSPAVGAALGDVEVVVGAEQSKDGQVVDGATAALRETEPRTPLPDILRTPSPALPREGAAGA